jgi:hypothetical protein
MRIVVTQLLTVPEPVGIAQVNTELREPSHHREDQVSGSDTFLGTHKPRSPLDIKMIRLNTQCMSR